MLKQKKIPMRTCVLTREKLPKKDLIRIVKDNLGNVFVDETGKKNGHGVYLKKDLEVVKKAKQTKCLEKLLETEIKDEVYEELENLIKD